MILLSWLSSSTVRHAEALRKQVLKILDHQRDVLAPKAVGEVEAAMAELRKTIADKAPVDAIHKQMEKLEKTAEAWLKPYPNASIRENVEVLLVALAVAMAIRTFFVQPFKIPTGSMQPSLYGVTSTNLLDHPEIKIPSGLERIREWFEGISYIDVRAKTDGELDGITEPSKFLIFNLAQKVVIGGQVHWIFFPPDWGEEPLWYRAGLRRGTDYHAGDEVIRLKSQAGDHLFVDRLTYNFRPPRRGEIIVFATKGIEGLARQDQFYIKRLVVLGGEHVQIGDDRHLIIDGERLDATTPGFEKVYSFDPKLPPMDSHYSGHVNQAVANRTAAELHQTPISLAPLFPDQNTTVYVPPGQYMVMGDNTMNSLDSRSWGTFSSTNVIGRSFLVYWPFTSRFGWGYSSH